MPQILIQGRIVHWFPSTMDEDAQNAEKEKDPVQKRQSPQAEDKAPERNCPIGAIDDENTPPPNWIVREYGDKTTFPGEDEGKQQNYSSILLRSQTWQGAMTLCMPARSSWSFQYMGYTLTFTYLLYISFLFIILNNSQTF